MGINVKFGYYGIDMTDWDLDLDDLPYAEITSYNSTTISGYVGGYKVVVKGSGFTYSSDGITGGTIKSIAETYGGSMVFSVTGLNLSVKKIADIAEKGSLSALVKLYKDQFKGDDTVSGSKYSDVLVAYDGNDKISGGAGNDTIYGGKGNDRIVGGLGADDLYGESGKDTFVFTSVTQSNSKNTDTIFDFNGKAGDKIDLSGIDANSLSGGNQSFDWIGSKKFSGDAGELRVVREKSDTYIYGDTNGDKVADLVIHLDDPMVLSKGYFWL